MGARRVVRYSECFKRQVVSEIESGRFGSMSEAKEHYGIGGVTTVCRWLSRFGKDQLRPKVVRVERANEVGELIRLRRKVAELERALGRTAAEALVQRSVLELACERLGTDAASFQKKYASRPSAGLPPSPPTPG